MKKIFVSLVLCILALVFMFAYKADSKGFAYIKPLDNEPVRFLTSELVPRDSSLLFVVSKDRIILYFDRKGLVNIYSNEGDFLYGMQIESAERGRGDIASDGKYLYVKSCKNTMYVFENTSFVRSFRREDAPNAYQEIELLMKDEPNHSVDTTTYYYIPDSNSIAKRTDGGPFVQVIAMPKENEDAYFLSIFILLGIAALTHYLRIKHMFARR